MNIEYNFHSGNLNQFVELELGPVEVSIKWPKMLNSKISQKLDDITEEL